MIMKRVDLENSLLTRNPELCKEWNYNKNEFGPEKYTLHSGKKVWWICLKCNFGWQASINNRTRIKGRGCPRCCNQFIDETNCLLKENPELCKEWNYNKNEFGPEKLAPHGNKKVWWVCSKCNFEWKSQICKRAIGKGCPRCHNKFIDTTNCLLTKNPELCKEWDFNKNEVGPENYALHSGKKVWWNCSKCDFNWKTRIHERANGIGCPRCASKVIDETNCLLTKNPELCNEWNYFKNDLSPEDYALFSNKKVWWECSECEFEWEASINNRAKGKGCPKCGGFYSIKCNKWIDSFNNSDIEKSYRIKINGFERKIETDGFDPITNTVYEFYGDLFHGNPQIFNPENKIFYGKTFGELYEKTIKREELIKTDGYNLITIWENEWDKLNKD